MTLLYEVCNTLPMSRKNKRVPDAAKVANKGWAEARLQHSNLNLTVPSGKVYKRPKAGSKNREW